MSVKGSFRLAGNAIAPANEDVAITMSGALTAYNGVIPAGSMTAFSQGFKFKGSAPGGGKMNVRLTTKDGILYKVQASAKNFSVGVGPGLPPLGTVTVRVGKDCFAMTLACTANAAGNRQTCKPPRR
jgi:hypothetical protein